MTWVGRFIACLWFGITSMAFVPVSPVWASTGEHGGISPPVAASRGDASSTNRLMPEAAQEPETHPRHIPSFGKKHAGGGGKTVPEEAGWQDIKGFAAYRAAPGTAINEMSPDSLRADNGEVVIEPLRSITVVTRLSQTHLRHGSAVLFRITDGSERIMVLSENGLDSVVLICEGKKVSLTSGQEALVTDHDPDIREITESDDIGRRQIRLNDIRDKHVVTAEFSLVHALQRDPLLYDLAHSKDRHDRSLSERILKTAVVLNAVIRGHGYYTTTSGQ